jgi:hypothetical protein
MKTLEELKSLDLNTITFSEFFKNEIIYNSRKEATCKGYEAEHLISVSQQMKEYNLKNNTHYKSRVTFEREVGVPDDRCYRVTPLEHIISHFLKAKEDENEIYIFEMMTRLNFKKLKESEKNILDTLIKISYLRELGVKKMSETLKGKSCKNKGKTMKEITGNPNYVDPKKGRTMKEITGNENWVSPRTGSKLSEETIKKLRESHSTEEYRKKFRASKCGKSSSLKGIPRTKDVKEKISESKRKLVKVTYPNGDIKFFKGLDTFVKETFLEKNKSAYNSFLKRKSYKGFSIEYILDKESISQFNE